MNTLRRNFILCVRTQQTRVNACVLRSKIIENRANVRQNRKYSVQPILCNGNIKQSYTSTRIQSVKFSTDAPTVSQLDYEKFCVETLDGLCDYIEELFESVSHLSTADVVNKDGVLTVSLGSKYGTYVINKQSPNKQIWLSSPTSGPKRFDFVYAKGDNKNGYWIYKHSGETLHEILDKEFTEIAQTSTKFQSLSFGSRC